MKVLFSKAVVGVEVEVGCGNKHTQQTCIFNL